MPAFTLRAGLVYMYTGCCGGLDIFVPNYICGFEAHFGDMSVVGGSWAVLDILEVTGRVSWRACCLKKNTFLINIVGKIVKMCLIVKQRHI